MYGRETVRALAAHYGTVAALSDATGLAQQTLCRWARLGAPHRGLVDLMGAFERATGRRVTRHVRMTGCELEERVEIEAEADAYARASETVRRLAHVEADVRAGRMTAEGREYVAASAALEVL